MAHIFSAPLALQRLRARPPGSRPPRRARWVAASALSALVGLLAGGTAPPVLAIDDGQGRDWRPLGQTVPLSGRHTWEQVSAVCPVDGLTACSGKLGSTQMKDWVWATREQVTGLFALYAPGIVDQPLGVGGFELQAAAALFQSRLGVTMRLKGCPTYQPCFNSLFSTGMTATVEPGFSPARPWGGEVSVDLEWGGGGFRLFTPLHPDMPRGLWMWRPTGLGTPAVHAYDDRGTLAQPGAGVAVANVLGNDWVGGRRANLARVSLAALAPLPAGLTLDGADASVQVAAGTAAGTYRFDYRACNLASPSHCDDATVTVVVPSFALVARPDTGTVPMAQGGTAIANVLANDQLGAAPPAADTVVLSTVSSTHPGVVLNPVSGAVQVAAGTPDATQVLVYRVCERARPANCAQTTATVSPTSIDARNDSARGSSKRPNTPLASVLANDRLGTGPATPALVRLSLVSITPPNAQIRLDTADGSVDVLGKTVSGLYQIVYRLCEAASPANCDEASVALDLSGGD